MWVLLLTFLVYGLGLVLTAVGSRLSGRCTTWCCALCGLPMWVVGGTVVPFCLALPQLMLAFLAAGMSVTSLAVGAALAGSVANLGLALAVCLLNPRQRASVDRQEFCRKCLLLLAACAVLIVFVRDGTLSYTGTGLLMSLFVLFVMLSIVYQHHYSYAEGSEIVTTAGSAPESPRRDAADVYGYTAHTMAFPVMSFANAMKNLAGVTVGLLLLAVGALALPLSSLMYRRRLPFGSQFRHYDLPICVAITLILLLPPLLRRRLYRWQGAACLALYLIYVAAAMLAPLSGA